MDKLCITKPGNVLPLIFIGAFAAAACSCSRMKEPPNISPAHKTATGQILGRVSVSIYNSLGIKDEESIARQLQSEAQQVYPGSRAITNIRYDKSTAYADVIK